MREREGVLTLYCPSKIASISLLLDHVLVNFPSCYVVVTVKCNVKETLIVTKVKVHLSSIIQYKYLTCVSVCEGRGRSHTCTVHIHVHTKNM